MAAAGGGSDGHIVNRGTGAGGARTNETGLSFEENTCLTKRFPCSDLCVFGKGKNDSYVELKITDDIALIRVEQCGLYNYMNRYHPEHVVPYPKAEKTYRPDAALIDFKRRIIYVIEKKYQQTSGSVDEKLETGECKRWYYSHKRFQGFRVNYAYVLCNWFKTPKYSHIREWNEMKQIPIFWGEDADYPDKLREWIIGCCGQ